MNEVSLRELRKFQEELDPVSSALGFGKRLSVAVNDGKRVKVETGVKNAPLSDSKFKGGL